VLPSAGQSGAAAQPGGQADRSGAAAIRSVLRIRPFRRLWIVLGAASCGDWLGLLASVRRPVRPPLDDGHL